MSACVGDSFGLQSRLMMAQPRRGQSSPDLRKTRHPWFYLPGRPLQTAEKLAARHESEARKRAENENVDRYFNKCRQETELHANWQANKSLMKQHRTAEVPDSPPFETEDDPEKIQMEQRQLDEFLSEISGHIRRYRVAAEAFDRGSVDTTEAVNYLLWYVDHHDEVAERRRKFFTNLKRHLQQSDYNYRINDPLRQVCFFIGEMLQFYHRTISSNLAQLQRINHSHGQQPDDVGGLLLSEPEQMEVFDLSKRCLQILDLYRELNESRDHDFQSMFTEERQTQWCRHKPIWVQEITVWDSLTVKLLDSNFHLIRQRIRRVLDNQKKLLKERLTLLEKLNDFLDQQCHLNPKFKPVLHYYMDRFIEVIVQE